MPPPGISGKGGQCKVCTPPKINGQVFVSLVRFDAQYCGYSAETCYNRIVNHSVIAVCHCLQIALQILLPHDRAVSGVGGLSLPLQGHSATECLVARQKK